MEAEANCPNCGAPIGLGQPGLPVLTCPFCQTLISKSDDTLSAVGDAGRVPFDVSPLQIGTRLVVDGKRGEIVGRERWAWDRGFWNEWLLQLPDGSIRWVAEEAGQFMVMEETEATPTNIEQLQAIDTTDRGSLGKRIRIGRINFTVADVKIIRCVASEGSLPHIIGAEFARESIDLRTRDKRAMTWQADGTGHSLWSGAYYRLADLEPSGLRRFEHWPEPAIEAAG
ncbi:MAG: DUF4178 domain-containing protein [Pseudomonadota bacterium]